jgi:hypothetical protein
MEPLLIAGILIMSLGAGVILGGLISYLTKPACLTEEQKQVIHDAVERVWKEQMEKHHNE